MYVECKECGLLIPEKDKAKCKCGYTEIRIINSNELKSFFEQYKDLPITITFLDTDDGDYITFVLEHEHLIINSTKAERTKIALYYSNKIISKQTLMRAIQNYQMKLYENEQEIKERIQQVSSTIRKQRPRTVRLHKATVSFLEEEAKKYNLSLAKFLSTLLKIYEQDEHEYSTI